MHAGDHDQADEILEGELVKDALPAPAPRPEPALPASGSPSPGALWARKPATQNAMAAATGFVAGAATLALVRHIGGRRLDRALPGPASERPLPSSGAPLGAGRTYLVHVRELSAEPPRPGVRHPPQTPARPAPLRPALGPGATGE